MHGIGCHSEEVIQMAFIKFFKRLFKFIFRERERRENERERNIDVREKHQSVACFGRVPQPGPAPQPQHVPWPEIKQVTFF